MSKPPATPRNPLALDDVSDEELIAELLGRFGEDPSREGLQETPARVIKAWRYMLSGRNKQPTDILKLFCDGAEGIDEMIFQANIPIWSNCEHHMLPFFGVAHIGYIPSGRVLGLSKFARIADMFARRLQVQERLCRQIAECLYEHLGAKGVGVTLQCRHTCMEARGVCVQGSVTTTTTLLGSFRDHDGARAEYLQAVATASGRPL